MEIFSALISVTCTDQWEPELLGFYSNKGSSRHSWIIYCAVSSSPDTPRVCTHLPAFLSIHEQTPTGWRGRSNWLKPNGMQNIYIFFSTHARVISKIIKISAQHATQTVSGFQFFLFSYRRTVGRCRQTVLLCALRTTDRRTNVDKHRLKGTEGQTGRQTEARRHVQIWLCSAEVHEEQTENEWIRSNAQRKQKTGATSSSEVRNKILIFSSPFSVTFVHTVKPEVVEILPHFAQVATSL